MSDLYELDLIKLVLADQSAGISAVTPCLGTKTGRMRDKLKREIFKWNDRVSYNVGKRDFGSRDEMQTCRTRFIRVVCLFLSAGPDSEKILFKFWQLSRTRKQSALTR